MCFKQEKYMFFQEEVTAEESTDGEVETQTYNQDSQDSIGEVSIFEKKKIFISGEMAVFSSLPRPQLSIFLEVKSQIKPCRFPVVTTYNLLKFRLAMFKDKYSIFIALCIYLYK